MKILLCGAADVETILPQFDALMVKMHFDSKNYLTGTIGSNNYRDWGKNSIEAVKKADIVVFVLIGATGDITWNIEYITAIKEGKPYILLVEKQLHNHYFKTLKEQGITVGPQHPYFKAKDILDRLMQEQRTPISFDNTKAEFSNVLALQINSELEYATTVLQNYNQRQSLVGKIRNRDFKIVIKGSFHSRDSALLKEILLDPFENKELRKRVFHYFTIFKVLDNEDILLLLDDSEQGLVRLTVDQLPEIVNAHTDTELVINKIQELLNDEADIGLIRRAISTFIKLDLKTGLKALLGLFPASDIGTPKRSLNWFLLNFDLVKTDLKDKEILSDLKTLIFLSKKYSDTQNTIEKLAESLEKLIAKEIEK